MTLATTIRALLRPCSLTVLSALLVISAGLPARALTPSLVVDAESGAVLHAEAPDQAWYPASLTKVMTAYLVFEALRAGQLRLDQKIAVSAHAAGQEPVRAGLRAGSELRLGDVLKAMIVGSANDAAVVLAEAVAGSETAFAQRMTAKARALGMTRTVFRNASGLPDRGQITTARDMATLARHMFSDFPAEARLFSERSATIGQRRMGSTNGWLGSFEGADGLKTGFTCASGYNLIGAATRGGRHLLGVTLGHRSSGARNAFMTRLLQSAFAGAKAGPTLGALPADPSDSRTPPEVLGGGQCGGGVRSAALSIGNLPGWGVILGAYPQQPEAKTVLDQRRKALGGLAGKARPAVIERQWEGVQRYAALLVGLDQGKAGQACKLLWERGDYCLALPPAQLNNPQAIWR